MTKPKMRRSGLGFFPVAMILLALLCLPPARAQNKGEPAKFDFYVLNVASGADFCHVPGAGPACKPPLGFVLHGLWTQNNDGTYPVNCSNEPGPADYHLFLDLTPDLPLLRHEWEKHGTCAAVKPERFFAMERKAYGMLRLPAVIKQPEREQTLNTAEVLRELYKINTGFPQGSLLLSCKQGKLTAVEACLSKDLKPIQCRNLPSCGDAQIKVEASPTVVHP